MSTAALFIVVVFALVSLYFLARVIVPEFRKYRGKRLITCPESKATAAVEVDAVHAAVTSGLSQPVLQLKACTRWPERRDCGQECLSQIAAAPADCLVRTIATRWYEGKSCARCGNAFGEIHWHERQPALMSANLKTVQWTDVRPETLPDVLATHQPVCWNCHIVETFRMEHPELAVERPWPR
jgi:hypothetical protein